VGANFQPVAEQGQNFQRAAAQAHNFQRDFQPAEKGKLKTWLKNMLWLNFRPFICGCEFCSTRSDYTPSNLRIYILSFRGLRLTARAGER
jgi:hypothetical protein